MRKFLMLLALGAVFTVATAPETAEAHPISLSLPGVLPRIRTAGLLRGVLPGVQLRPGICVSPIRYPAYVAPAYPTYYAGYYPAYRTYYAGYSPYAYYGYYPAYYAYYGGYYGYPYGWVY